VLLPVLKAVWLASDQLCNQLLKPALPEWLEQPGPERSVSRLAPSGRKRRLIRFNP